MCKDLANPFLIFRCLVLFTVFFAILNNTVKRLLAHQYLCILLYPPWLTLGASAFLHFSVPPTFWPSLCIHTPLAQGSYFISGPAVKSRWIRRFLCQEWGWIEEKARTLAQKLLLASAEPPWMTQMPFKITMPWHCVQCWVCWYGPGQKGFGLPSHTVSAKGNKSLLFEIMNNKNSSFHSPLFPSPPFFFLGRKR